MHAGVVYITIYTLSSSTHVTPSNKMLRDRLADVRVEGQGTKRKNLHWLSSEAVSLWVLFFPPPSGLVVSE